MAAAAVPPAAWLVALAGLPKMGPARLLALIRSLSPDEAWAAVASGRVLLHPEVVERMGPSARSVADAWRAAAARVDVAAVWSAHRTVDVTTYGGAGYPSALEDDPEPPAVLFRRGLPVGDDVPRVAIVGTRRCTRSGFDLARELGHDLSAEGVQIVSGLALGIDGAAHAGAFAAGAAPPVAVVASGLDVVYPSQHRRLWEDVATRGSLLSECPLGTKPEAWRFPARNRIIAGLADAVVVVESATTGGSMYTVEEALARDRQVLAVPGSIRARASAGTNRLLVDGAGVVRDADDVLAAIGRPQRSRRKRGGRSPGDPGGDAGVVLRALRAGPATLDGLVAATGLALGPLSLAVADLEAADRVTQSGLWYEHVEPTR